MKSAASGFIREDRLALLSGDQQLNALANLLGRTGLLRRDLDYHVLRAAMVVIFAWFGYDKWFQSEISALAPLISHGPLIFWTIPVLGIHGTAVLLGTAEWTFGSLLLLGFWNKKLGMLGALGSIATFVSTLTILPFVPDGWDAGAGGFPAMAMNAAFLLKDLVLLAVSVYLLKQDVQRVLTPVEATA
jgi:uncharacterized membrane protein YkgB